jgi:hypothetical protein
MVLHRNLLLFLKSADHAGYGAGAQLDKGMTVYAMEPVPVGKIGAFGIFYRRIVPFGAMFCAVEYKGFCEPLFF